MNQEDDVDFDVLVIGGGSAGYAAAGVAGRMGAAVGLVERGPIGGLCILEGCMPSKALIRSSDVLHLTRTSGELGVHPGTMSVDFARVMARKRELVDEFADYRREEIGRARGVTLLLGGVRFTGQRSIALRPTSAGGEPEGGVAERTYTARKLVLATGSYPWVPPVRGIETAGYITSEGALHLAAAPDSMVIVGAGAIALELGQFYARMGTRVTMLQRGGRILSRADQEVGDALHAFFGAEGIDIHTNATVRNCVRRPDGTRIVVADVEEQRREFPGAVVLVAAGRRADVRGLHLEAAGINLDAEGGFVDVDGAMRTSNPDVFAAGDVVSRRQMTHLAVLQGEIAGFNAARALGLGPAQGVMAAADAFISPAARRLGGVADSSPEGELRMDHSVVPQVIFTDPRFASVGLDEQQARAKGVDYLAARYDFADLGMAEVMGQTKGFAKMLAAPPDGRILGVQILGQQADVLIHEAIVAMAFGATAEQLARIPHYHPTLSEILTYPAEELATKVRRAPG